MGGRRCDDIAAPGVLNTGDQFLGEIAHQLGFGQSANFRYL